MHTFGENGQFQYNIVFGGKTDGRHIFFVRRGSGEEFELFFWMLNGIENGIQFTLEMEKGGFPPFLDVEIAQASGTNKAKNMLLGVLK